MINLLFITVTLSFSLLLPQDLILSNVYEIHQHNIGTRGNVVLLHKDGHQEAVYDSNGLLVKDPANMGSYNICNPIAEPICHFKVDTLPWLQGGNSPQDPTTVNQRLLAFLMDYRDGLKRTIYSFFNFHRQ